jgi:hypothetical protein
VLSAITIDRRTEVRTAVVHENKSPRGKSYTGEISRAYFFVDEPTILRLRTRITAYPCNERTVSRGAVIERT